VLAAANGSAASAKVSAVIAVGRRRGASERLLRSLLERSSYSHLEAIVVGSGEPLAGCEDARVQWVEADSALRRGPANNLGASRAGGEQLLFLDPECEVIETDWIEALMLHAGLPGVAAVGPMLVRPGGKVEQAGFAVGLRDPAAPMLAGFSADGDGYYGSMPCARDVSALSAECMLVAKAAFDGEGGFDEHYDSQYEDFDLCLRLGSRGLRCAYAPGARLLSHRSEAARRAANDIVDRALFVDNWYDLLSRGDPYFNPGFARQQADYVPAGWRERVYRATAPLGMR
jgi:GT2 family glycosyltransferase